MKIAFTETVLSSIEIHEPYADREDESFMGADFVDRHEILQRVTKAGKATPEEARAVIAALSDIADVEPPNEARSIDRAISRIMSQLAAHDAETRPARIAAAYPPGATVQPPGTPRAYEIAPYSPEDAAAGKIRLYLSDKAKSEGFGTLVAVSLIEGGA